MPEFTRELSEEQEKLVESGRQDTTTVANVSITVYTTVQYRFEKLLSIENAFKYFDNSKHRINVFCFWKVHHHFFLFIFAKY
jgi:hypothetical protein